MITYGYIEYFEDVNLAHPRKEHGDVCGDQCRRFFDLVYDPHKLPVIQREYEFCQRLPSGDVILVLFERGVF